MEGILNFVITKIHPLLYKIISSYRQTFFYGKFFSVKKKKKKYRKHVSTKRKFLIKKKKKVSSLLDSSLVIVTNNRKSITIPVVSRLNPRCIIGFPKCFYLFIRFLGKEDRRPAGRSNEIYGFTSVWLGDWGCWRRRRQLREKTGKRGYTGKGTAG